jgi:hypothetical protein
MSSVVSGSYEVPKNISIKIPEVIVEADEEENVEY